MPTSKKSAKVKKSNNKQQSESVRIDVIFAGPLLFVPETTNGGISGLEVFAPCNGHPMGAVFLPEVIFTDAELNDPKCGRWPDPETFSLLDPHSYYLELSQSENPPDQKTGGSFPVTSIPATNLKIKPGRRISADWDVAIKVQGSLSGWSSHRMAQVTEGLFHGGDAPAPGSTFASLHRITYDGVTAADFQGVHGEARAYLRENVAKGGTLIVIGEIPYQSTLLHERRAIEAIAKLAGLDLHLSETAPKPYQTRLMNHTLSCGASMVVAPS